MLIDDTQPKYTLLSVLRTGLFLVVVGIIIFAILQFNDQNPSASTDDEMLEPLPDIGIPKRDASATDPYITIEGRIERDQTVGAALDSHGVAFTQTNQLVAALKGLFNFRYARPGSSYELTLRRKDKRIERFRFQHTSVDIYEAARVGNRLVGHKVEIPTQKIIAEASGEVTFSLYAAMAKAGEKAGLVAAFIDVFAWDIDFAKATRSGDKFKVICEKIIRMPSPDDEALGVVIPEEGEVIRYGRILAAEYTGAVGDFRTYWFEPKDESFPGSYYLEDGRSTRKTMLATPLKFTRISSSFNLRRKHPVLGFTKAHMGTDFAAPTGTPVWSMASGVITYAGFKGANGNLVVIKHDKNRMTSLYAHLHRIAPGIKKGVRVRQKQVIGQVGTTGRSTGPHLHLGVKINGRYVNAESLEVKRGEPIVDKLRPEFDRTIATLKAQMDAIEITTPQDRDLE